MTRGLKVTWGEGGLGGDKVSGSSRGMLGVDRGDSRGGGEGQDGAGSIRSCSPKGANLTRSTCKVMDWPFSLRTLITLFGKTLSTVAGPWKSGWNFWNWEPE